METIQLKKRLNDIESEVFKGRLMDASNYDELFTPKDDGLELLKPDGSLLIKIYRNIIPSKIAEQCIPFMQKAKEPITNRGTAAGVQGGGAVYQVGTISGYKTKTTRVPGNAARERGSSSTVGYYDRYPRIPFCRICRHTEENPAMWKKFIPLVGVADRIFREGHPARYAPQKKLAELTDPAWVIGNSAFTTVTINKNFRTAAHKDAGDFESGFGVMSCISTGRVKGGYLVFPQYRVAVAAKSLDMVLFDVHEWHGNTDLGCVGKSERFTCVFYYRELMSRCGSPEHEFKRSQKCRDLGTLYCKEEIESGNNKIKLAIEAK